MIRIFYLRCEVFPTRESALGLTGWTLSYRKGGYMNTDQGIHIGKVGTDRHIQIGKVVTSIQTKIYINIGKVAT